MKKISVCTVCMNRLYHLSKTLPVNIAENQGYPNLEFVILNYNSRDGMDDWMRSHMDQHIASGLVKYYRTDEPEYFDMAHSKNMVSRLATGEIICNIDADIFAGPGYVTWVQECFAALGPDIVITTLRKDAIPYRDTGGKICFTREIFTKVNGYDESLIGYGMDDVDLCNRIEKAGVNRVFIEEEKYLRYIPHSDRVRLANYRYPHNLKGIYHCTTEAVPGRLKVLYLFNDGSAEELVYRYNEAIQSDLVATFVGWTLEEGGQRKGNFHRSQDRMVLNFVDSPALTYAINGGQLRSTGPGAPSAWQELIQGESNYHMAEVGYTECLNRRKFWHNDKSAVHINEKGWGRGNVVRNFNTEDVVSIR